MYDPVLFILDDASKACFGFNDGHAFARRTQIPKTKKQIKVLYCYCIKLQLLTKSGISIPWVPETFLARFLVSSLYCDPPEKPLDQGAKYIALITPSQ